MNEDIFMKIVSAVITLLCVILTSVVIPWIKSKIDAEQTEKLAYYVDMAVRCAEQVYTPEQWVEKKNYVTSYITLLVNNAFDLKLSAQDIDVLIEGAVNQIKKG